MISCNVTKPKVKLKAKKTSGAYQVILSTLFSPFMLWLINYLLIVISVVFEPLVGVILWARIWQR